MEDLVSPLVYSTGAVMVAVGLSLCGLGIGFIRWRFDCVREALLGDEEGS